MLRPLLAAALVALLAACGGDAARADVTDLRLQREGRSYPTLSGTLVNRGNAPIQSADVFITLYDADNRPIEDVMVQVGRVAPGDSARFDKALDLAAGGAKLKFVGIN